MEKPKEEEKKLSNNIADKLKNFENIKPESMKVEKNVKEEKTKTEDNKTGSILVEKLKNFSSPMNTFNEQKEKDQKNKINIKKEENEKPKE